MKARRTYPPFLLTPPPNPALGRYAAKHNQLATMWFMKNRTVWEKNPRGSSSQELLGCPPPSAPLLGENNRLHFNEIILSSFLTALAFVGRPYHQCGLMFPSCASHELFYFIRRTILVYLHCLSATGEGTRIRQEELGFSFCQCL